MSAEREFDLLLRSWFDDSAPPIEPDALLDTVIARTGDTRPRPAWLVRLGGEPMPDASRSGLIRFAPLAVVTVALVMAVLIGISMFVRLPDVGPSPAPGPTVEATPVPPVLSRNAEAAAPGRYTMQGSASPVYSAGWPSNVSAELPAGWVQQHGAVRGGGIHRYASSDLSPSGQVLDPANDTHLAELTMWSVGNVVRNGCPQNALDEELMDPPVGPSVEDLATALRAIPGVVATRPVTTAIDGFPGVRINLTVPAGGSCDFFQLWMPPHEPGHASTYSSLPGWIHQIWIIDIDGLRFVVDAAAAPDAPAELGTELQRIIDSIEIQPYGIAIPSDR